MLLSTQKALVEAVATMAPPPAGTIARAASCKQKNGTPYENPTEVKASDGGYVVDFYPQKTSYHFRDSELTAYDEDGKELWNGDLVPEETVG